MTTTSPPVQRAAGALSCSDALEAERPARQRRELVWGSGDLVVQPHEKCSPADPAAAPLCNGRHFRNDGWLGRWPPARDRVADCEPVGADAPGHDSAFRRLVLSLVVRRPIVVAIGD